MGKDSVGVLLADVLHQKRVLALQPDVAGPLVQVHLVHLPLPVLHAAHVLVTAVAGGHLHIGQVQVVDHHVACAQLVALLGKNRNKGVPGDAGLHQHGLSLLDVEPHPGQGIGVLALHFL